MMKGDVMLYGRFQHNIDAKGRLFVPAKLREKLGIVFIAAAVMDHCVCLYSMEEWEKLQEGLAQMPMTKARKRQRYLSVNKPFGFDKCDLLLGGQLARLETARVRLADYLAGRISRIEELEADRLPYDGTVPGKYALHWRKYDHIATPHIQKFWT